MRPRSPRSRDGEASRSVASNARNAGALSPANGRGIAYGEADPRSASLRSAPLPLKRGEEGRLALRPALPLPRRAGERWFAKGTGVGVDSICDCPAASGERVRAAPTSSEWPNAKARDLCYQPFPILMGCVWL